MKRAAPATEVVAEFWGRSAPDMRTGFYGHPATRAYIRDLVTGEAARRGGDVPRDWYERWAVATYLGDRAPVDACLSLACGFGEMERILSDLGAFRHCLGVDISPGAIEAARRAARDHPQLRYEVADLNTAVFPPETYELVWSNGALHHIADLHHAIGQIYRTLRPGGLLVANEYVGPSHQDLPPRQREAINAVIHLLPPRFRDHTEDTFVPSWFRQRRWRIHAYHALRAMSLRPLEVRVNPAWPARRQRIARLYNRLPRRPAIRLGQRFRFGQVWDVNAYYFRDVDPSEGVRADAIIATLRQAFGDVEVRPYHGSVLAYALGPRFYAEYDPRKAEDRQVFRMLTDVERSLIEAGELAPDHAHIVARKGATTGSRR